MQERIKHSAALLGAIALFSGCSQDASENVDSTTLGLNESRVLGFESLSDWSGTAASLSLSDTHTEGAKSIATSNVYYTEVVSLPVGPLGAVDANVTFDFFLPNGVGAGNVKLIVESSTAQIYYITVGTKAFSALSAGQWNTVSLPLSSDLRTKLSGNYTDLKLRFVIQAPQITATPYRLDKLSFGSNGTGGSGSGGSSSGGTTSLDLVESDVLARWSAHSEDVATNTLSLLSGSQARLGQTALRAETTSGFDFWLEYIAPTPIDVSSKETLNFYVNALNIHDWQIDGPVIVLVDSSGARATYTPGSQNLPRDGASWVDVRVPLSGGVGWTQSGGAVNLTAISKIEFHADTWDSGYRLDLDGVRFGSFFDQCTTPPLTLTAQANSRATTSTVTFSAASGAVGYNVYRGLGSGPLKFVNRSRTTTFEDSGLTAGTNYRYEVRPVTRDGCESGAAQVSTTTSASSTGLTKVPTLNVLVPIYRGGPIGYTDAEVAKIKAGIELSRQFYYRNSRARLNLSLEYFEIDAAAPNTDGPTLENVESDLRARGVIDDQYDAIYPVGRAIGGCYGGFRLLGHTAGAFGNVCGTEYPSNDSGADFTLTWSFTHEFQHAFDGVLSEGSGQDVIAGHPDSVYQDMAYSGPIIDAGEHFDWEAATLRAFSAYGTLAAPFNGYLEVVDPDGDGLASNDARLPSDELRFGSRADLADTDADGLSDRGEYSAGIFASSNPNSVDSDADGQRDNVDPTPRAAIAATIHSFSPTIDGTRDSGYSLFRAGVEFSNVSGFGALTYFAYDANYLYVFAEMNQSASLLLQIDGSGANGFWQGDDTYSFSLTPGAAQPLNHTSRHGTTETGTAPATSQLVTRTVGVTTMLEARIPRTNLGQGFGWTGSTTNGFSTSLGSVLGLKIKFSRFSGAGELFDEPYATQNEYYHFDDVTLN